MGSLLLVCAFGADRALAAEGSPDYAVTITSGLYEPPPSAVSRVSNSNASSVAVTFPFEFPYFGVLYDQARVTIGGYVAFDNTNTGAIIGPTDPSQVSPGSTADGACAPLWTGLAVSALTSTYAWTAGSAPNRRYIVSYENVRLYAGGSDLLTFQVRFFEGSGRIEFAYAPDTSPSTWPSVQYSVGVVAPGADTRWVAPVSTSTTNSGHPGADYRLDPIPVTWSGSARYERLTPTESGLSASGTLVPARHLGLEVHTSGGAVMARGAAESDGSFRLHGFRGAPFSSAEIVAISVADGVRVLGSGGAPYAQLLAGGVDPSADDDVGSLAVDAAADPAGTFRAAAHLTSTLQAVRAWVAARTDVDVAPLDVSFDVTSTAPTSYARMQGTTPAQMRVAGPAAANPDMWDDGVFLVSYGRHVLAALSAPQLATIDDRPDAVTDAVNAFAVGFGNLLLAAVTDADTWIDTGGSQGTLLVDLETPEPASSRRPDVGAWVGAALFDLLDPANEPHDRADGTIDGGASVIATLETFDAPPDAVRFAGAFVEAGFDGAGMSRDFIAHGLLADDAYEPNDDDEEPAEGPGFGLTRTGLTLSVGNEDWFDLVLPTAVADALVEAGMNRAANPATVELQVVDGTGAVVATKQDSGLGPMALATGPLGAGTYRVRLRHVTGLSIPAYTLQSAERLALALTPLPDWTVGFPYAQDLGISGGVGARTLTVETGSGPPGLSYDVAQKRVTGTPVTVGTYSFQLVLRDSGEPQHAAVVNHQVTINDVLALDLAEFLPFALGSATQLDAAHTGGTLPLDVELVGGALPAGIAIAADGLTFAGTPLAQGSTALSVRATDVAGSSDEAASTAVVCVRADAGTAPTATLAAGDAACGFFVDAVRGSKIALTAAPAPKRAKRTMRALLLDADGVPVEGAKIKLKSRATKASVSAMAVPTTGRYYIVLASDEGEESELVGSSKVGPPKSDKGRFDDVASGDRLTIEFGALAGARLKLTAKAAKTSGLTLSVLSLIGPDEQPLPLDGVATSKGSKLTIDAELPQSGTWRLLVRAAGSRTGAVTYKSKLSTPKGVVFTEE